MDVFMCNPQGKRLFKKMDSFLQVLMLLHSIDVNSPVFVKTLESKSKRNKMILQSLYHYGYVGSITKEEKEFFYITAEGKKYLALLKEHWCTYQHELRSIIYNHDPDAHPNNHTLEIKGWLQCAEASRMILLKLLSEKPRYLTELRRLRHFLSGKAVPSFDVPPVLYGLYNEQHLCDGDSLSGPGQQSKRKYYAITPSGRQYLKELIVSWEQKADEVNCLLESKREAAE